MSSRHDSRSIGGGRPACSTLFRAQTPAKLRRCLHQLDEAAARNGHCGGEDGRFPRGLPAVSSRAAPETGMTFRGRLIFRRKFASQGRQGPKRRSRWGPGKGRSGRGVGGGGCKSWLPRARTTGKSGPSLAPTRRGPSSHNTELFKNAQISASEILVGLPAADVLQSTTLLKKCKRAESPSISTEAAQT